MKKRKTKPKKPVPITGEYLVKLFRDKIFLNNIKEVNNISRRTGREASFEVGQLIVELTYDISPVEIGQYNSTSGVGEDSIFSIWPFKTQRFDFYDLVGIHSHPMHKYDKQRHYMIPSARDLSSLSISRMASIEGFGINIKPIEIIHPQDRKKQISLLLIQETTPFPCYEPYEEPDISFNTSRVSEPQDVARILRETGNYNAEVIRVSGKGYQKRDLEKIAKFAFTPKIVNQERFNAFLEDGLFELVRKAKKKYFDDE